MLELKSGKVRMDGEIGDYFENGISPKHVADVLDQAGGQDIEITLSSYGGDVVQGVNIHNMLSSYQGQVTIVVDAMAASIASVIAMAADDLAIYKNSSMMIHNASTVAGGNADDFRDVAEILDFFSERIAGYYADRSGKPVDFFLDLMKKDEYISDQRALEIGLVDRVIDTKASKKHQGEPAMAACGGFPSVMRNRLRLKTKIR